MYPNSVTSPVGPASIVPVAAPIQPAVPFTIKIDIVPTAPQPYGMQQPGVIYNIPQTSLYEPNKTAENKSEAVKADDKKSVAEKAEVKKSEVKSEDKKFENALSQVLAAQAGVKPVAASNKSSEAVTDENKVEDKKEVKHNKPEIVKPEVIKPSVDIDGLMEILNSNDYEEQADALEAISEVTVYAPERAGELLDSKVVDALTGIMEKDTSSLQGKDKELADRNKEYAMFTTATLQKLFADQVKKEGNVDVPTKDLIGMSSIVKNLATNPNDSVREAAVASLGYVSKPENKRDMVYLLGAAAKDPSEVVRAQANKHLSRVLA